MLICFHLPYEVPAKIFIISYVFWNLNKKISLKNTYLLSIVLANYLYPDFEGNEKPKAKGGPLEIEIFLLRGEANEGD